MSRLPYNINSLVSPTATDLAEIITLGNEVKETHNRDMIPKFNALLVYLKNIESRIENLERKA